jgi:hypothetical protein
MYGDFRGRWHRSGASWCNELESRVMRRRCQSLSLPSFSPQNRNRK